MNHLLNSVSSDALIAMRASQPSVRLGLILPLGAVEQHGAFLPVTCDADIAIGASASLAQAVSSTGTYRAFAAPAIPYGPVPGADRTAGTSSVGFSELGAYLLAVTSGFAATGTWDFLVIVNAHAHNHGRAIEASSLTFGRHRVPVLVLHVYEFMRVCEGLDLVPGSHGGEFEIALHHYYARQAPFGGHPSATPAPRPRPASIYGLDLMPRSFGGIVAPTVPIVDRAIAHAETIGARMDSALSQRALADLDAYFAHWHRPDDVRESRA